MGRSRLRLSRDPLPTGPPPRPPPRREGEVEGFEEGAELGGHERHRAIATQEEVDVLRAHLRAHGQPVDS